MDTSLMGRSPPQATLDPTEVARFTERAGQWWDAGGPFRPLHRLGPARLTFIRDSLAAHFERPAAVPRPLSGLTVLDVGCGGGLIAEPLARLGGTVTGIDPSEENVEAAHAHAAPQNLAVTYRAVRAEDVAGEGRTFDVVVCLEVLEHVPDPGALVAVLASLVRPGGVLIVSTINRTIAAYALAIVGAEYVLRWLPTGTHRWERFITPDELTRFAAAAGLDPPKFAGLVYDFRTDRWALGNDTGVNYLASAARRPNR
ncbi:MAG: bifunctional 2-polyprenyl-6-hydroxyphenol methylase/3-demethylubiquinol 3-O-methyltransferase UbiG [Hyphomicrobiaceae bacterium]